MTGTAVRLVLILVQSAYKVEDNRTFRSNADSFLLLDPVFQNYLPGPGPGPGPGLIITVSSYLVSKHGH